MDEAKRIQAQIEPKQSEQLRLTRVWRLDQFTGLGCRIERGERDDGRREKLGELRALMESE